LYALVGSGMTLIFGVMRVINVAHGEFLMLGAYLTVAGAGFLHLNPLLTLAVSVPLLFALGFAVQSVLVQRLPVRERELSSLLLTFGFSVFLWNAAQLLFSADLRSVDYLSGSISLAGIDIARNNLVAGAVSVLAMGILAALLRATRVGKAIRAVSQNESLARACGIDTARVQAIAFGIGAALTGAAGTLVAITYVVYPQVGAVYLLRAFAVVILGGLGSVSGAFVAGILLGIVESFGTLILTTQLGQAISYFLLVLVLLIRPAGLFGQWEPV